LFGVFGAGHALGRRPDQQHDLALRGMRLVIGDQAVRQAGAKFLVQLGQLARHGDIAVGQRLGDGSQRLGQSRCGFIEHQRRVDIGQFLQRFAPRLVLVRQEAGEKEAVVGQSAERERRDRGAGAGQRGHRNTLGAAVVDEAIAGIGNHRRARIADQRDRAIAHRFDEPGAVAVFAVVVIAPHRLRYPQMLEQLAGDARILARDPVAAAQHVDRAQCDIP
jgi:hypothetical protein